VQHQKPLVLRISIWKSEYHVSVWKSGIFFVLLIGHTADFVFQTEGAGTLIVSEKYGSYNKSKGLLLSNNAFPSYAAVAGSSFSHVNIPQSQILSSNSFVEFSYNFYRVPRAYGGFYMTILRMDRDQQDMFDYNLQACTDSTPGTGSCPQVMFYR
jgi:hypothetical protein